ncbi:MAG TPA: FAD-dependent oxidoreductase [Burkholderiaceae bacterium]|nr:FAD-dependent oxidoreductase [Burkholderiaceae bacterium]
MKKRLLLAGAGTAHLEVLAELARSPLADTEITLVTPFARQIYSGMLPGWIAGHYAIDECTIPIPPLARRADARLVLAHVARLDLEQRIAYTESAQVIPFDVISFDIGPTLDMDALPGLREHAIALRPLEQLLAVWQRLVTQLEAAEGPQTLTIIGGGAGGLELALAIAYRAETAQWPLRVQLLAGAKGLLPEFPPAVQARLRAYAGERSVRLIEDDAVEMSRHTVLLADGGELASDVTLVALGAAAAQWPRAAGLAVDANGFIAVNEHLQSLSHPFVFGAGDCVTMVDHPRPKSGVFAVRAAPPLARNLRRALAERSLVRYIPQRHALYLITTGPKVAVASWRSLSAAGGWAWRWKDRIDRRFVARYLPYTLN